MSNVHAKIELNTIVRTRCVQWLLNAESRKADTGIAQINDIQIPED